MNLGDERDRTRRFTSTYLEDSLAHGLKSIFLKSPSLFFITEVSGKGTPETYEYRCRGEIKRLVEPRDREF